MCFYMYMFMYLYVYVCLYRAMAAHPRLRCHETESLRQLRRPRDRARGGRAESGGWRRVSGRAVRWGAVLIHFGRIHNMEKVIEQLQAFRRFIVVGRPTINF